MREVVIASAARTAIGSFGGTLKTIPAVELGAIVVKEAINRAGIKPEQVEEVVLGNVIQAGLGQNPARQATLKAGIPDEVPAMTINKVCGSGLRTVALAAQMIKAGDADIVVAGGMESMSQAPYAIKDMRWGHKMNSTQLTDALPAELCAHLLVVEESGFEPLKQIATDLQSAPFGHSGTPPN